jgi:hypothetical protein
LVWAKARFAIENESEIGCWYSATHRALCL